MPVVAKARSVAPLKDLYAIGEIPPLGHVPDKMHAWVIRKERHGPPDKSFQLEVASTTMASGPALAFRSHRWTVTSIRSTSRVRMHRAWSGRSAPRSNGGKSVTR
jgi:hypothetical protein